MVYTILIPNIEDPLFALFAGMVNRNIAHASVSETTLATLKANAAGDLSTGSRDLMSGKAFDNGCTCQLNGYSNLVDSLLRGASSCKCFAPQLQPEIEFVNALMDIGVTLGGLETKEQRSKY